ncbi:aminotransferase class V-fold PLP-dependent enzyme [Romboutsia sedimentorum]|uniref:aminotransferase class V-fold PLP-dependent enzyme n=1 Tax=Romboutsia sedimentorum TaxID=1368474 RepID=UPI0024DECFB8|nr:aminotransferase class V-fold PLP-dependent enzyme [Romboutsia sedimentorum]MDK2584453.1 aminotransferase class V-fold PLP-dependent enzyme [Romboutsia sedimentorum]
MEVVYLDNAATTFPKPKEVYDYMIDMYKNHGINAGRGIGSSEDSIENIIKDTRKMLKDLVNANDSYEAVFAPSATIALNQILWGLDYNNIKNIYVSPFEHNAVLRTLNAIKDEKQVNIKNLEFNKDKWEYDFDKIKYEFSKEKPDLIIVSHVSNVFGYISPINKIGKLSKKHNSLYLVDGAQSVAAQSIDIKESNIDFLVFAGHKTLYAPFGIAGFILNKDIKLKPYIYGGTGTESANMDMPESIPTRYEAGSLNVMSVFGLYRSLKWINDIGVENIKIREEELTEKLLNIISKYDYIKAYIPNNNHTSIVSFTINDYPVDTMAESISKKYNITLRHGLHCAPNAHNISNTFPEGTIRVSIGYFTKDEDLERLDEALEELEYEI